MGTSTRGPPPALGRAPGRARPASVALGRRVEFRRAWNPNSSCSFPNARQMGHWALPPYFLDRDASDVGPLESAASLGIMRAFAVDKPAPACASFLEVQHFGSKFLSRIRRPDGALPAPCGG